MNIILNYSILGISAILLVTPVWYIPEALEGFLNANVSEISILSLLGTCYVVLLIAYALLFGYVSRLLIKYILPKGPERYEKNLEARGRILRAFLGSSIIFFTVLSSWNPLVIFIGGFMFYEAYTSWCIMYALFRKEFDPTSYI